MITKGIITSIDFNGNTCEVRMPYFENAGNDKITGTATISNIPGMYNGYKVNDVVWVAFEDGLMNTPVIIGKLYLGAAAEKKDPRGTLNVETSSVSKTATIPADTVLSSSVDRNVSETTQPFGSLFSVANELSSLKTNVAEQAKFNNGQIESVLEEITKSGSTLMTKIVQNHNAITLEASERESADTRIAENADKALRSVEADMSIKAGKIAADVGEKISRNSQDEVGSYKGLGWDLSLDGWRVYKNVIDQGEPSPANVVFSKKLEWDPVKGTYYFTNNKYWKDGTVHCYAWKSGHEDDPNYRNAQWPGVLLTDYELNEYGEKVYAALIDASKYDYVIFNGTQQVVDPSTGSITEWPAQTEDLYILELTDNQNAWYIRQAVNHPDRPDTLFYDCGRWVKPMDTGDSRNYSWYVTINNHRTNRPCEATTDVDNFAVTVGTSGGKKYWYWNEPSNPTYHNQSTGVEADSIKPILVANEKGLSVFGTIEAIDGHISNFTIGQAKDSMTGASLQDGSYGIYSDGYLTNETSKTEAQRQIKRFLSPFVPNPAILPATGATGVYIGTDGIMLGDNFFVDSSGNVLAKSLKIGATSKTIETALSDIDTAAQGYATAAQTAAEQNAVNTINNNLTNPNSTTYTGIVSITEDTIDADYINARVVSAGGITVFDAAQDGNLILSANDPRYGTENRVLFSGGTAKAGSISLSAPGIPYAGGGREVSAEGYATTDADFTSSDTVNVDYSITYSDVVGFGTGKIEIYLTNDTSGNPIAEESLSWGSDPKTGIITVVGSSITTNSKLYFKVWLYNSKSGPGGCAGFSFNASLSSGGGGFEIQKGRIAGGTQGRPGSIIVSTGAVTADHAFILKATGDNTPRSDWSLTCGENFGVTNRGVAYLGNLTFKELVTGYSRGTCIEDTVTPKGFSISKDYTTEYISAEDSVDVVDYTFVQTNMTYLNIGNNEYPGIVDSLNTYYNKQGIFGGINFCYYEEYGPLARAKQIYPIKQQTYKAPTWACHLLPDGIIAHQNQYSSDIGITGLTKRLTWDQLTNALYITREQAWESGSMHDDGEGGYAVKAKVADFQTSASTWRSIASISSTDPEGWRTILYATARTVTNSTTGAPSAQKILPVAITSSGAYIYITETCKVSYMVVGIQSKTYTNRHRDITELES